MRNLSKLPCEFPWNNLFADRRGAASLLAAVILTALVLLIGVGTAMIGLTGLETGSATLSGTQAILAAESCVEEAVLRLSRDVSYTGGELEVGDVACTMSVTGAPCGTCTIRVTATSDDHVRTLQAQLDGSVLKSWSEID